jgi:hypothetical protein
MDLQKLCIIDQSVADRAGHHDHGLCLLSL